MSTDINKAFKQWSDSNPARTFEDAFKAGVVYGKSTQDDYWARFKDHEIRSIKSQIEKHPLFIANKEIERLKEFEWKYKELCK